MDDIGVCAVIVTFHPQSDAFDNLIKVRRQVQGLVVVDNGSVAELLAPFRMGAAEWGFNLIENKENLGIAAALNIGARWARLFGYRWVLLLDQDSTVTDGFVSSMLVDYSTCSEPDRIAILTPKHINPLTGEEKIPFLGRDGSPLDPITSGSMIPINTFDRCGWFEEDLVIDCVDTEYAFRAASLGYRILSAPSARLFHLIGCRDQYSPTMNALFRSSHYGPARRYYISRNRTVMLRRYWNKHPRWCLHVIKLFIVETAKILLAEEYCWRKLLISLRGILDGLAGRMGKVVKL